MKRSGLPTPKPWIFDGMHCGNSDGLLVAVYEPRWWQLGRWLRWLRLRYLNGNRAAVGTIELTFEGEPVRCRVLEVEPPGIRPRSHAQEPSKRA